MSIVDLVFNLSKNDVYNHPEYVFKAFEFFKSNPEYLKRNALSLVNQLGYSDGFTYFKTEKGMKDILHAMHKYTPNPVKNYSVEEIFVFVQEQVLFIDKINKGVV